jgi:hypothetical protein
LLAGTVPSSKNLVDGKVPSSKNLVASTVPFSKSKSKWTAPLKKGESGRWRDGHEGVGLSRRGGWKGTGNFPLLLLSLRLGATIEKERVAPRGG